MIREFTPADTDALLGLLRLNTPLFFAPEEEADYIHYLQKHIHSYYVLEENNTIVAGGGINFMEDGITARISWDMVSPDVHGKGFGSKLTQYRIEQIKTRPNIKTIEVRTTQLVHPFYEKQGFTLIETVKDYWAKGFDLYRMEMKIQ